MSREVRMPSTNSFQSLSDSLVLKVDSLLLFPLINVAKTGAPCVHPRFCQELKKQKLYVQKENFLKKIKKFLAIVVI